MWLNRKEGSGGLKDKWCEAVNKKSGKVNGPTEYSVIAQQK